MNKAGGSVLVALAALRSRALARSARAWVTVARAQFVRMSSQRGLRASGRKSTDRWGIMIGSPQKALVSLRADIPLSRVPQIVPAAVRLPLRDSKVAV
jgi:hypothetical protein